MTRNNAIAAGVCFVTAAVPAIVALALYGPVLGHADYVTGSGAALFPVTKRQNGSALGYVCGRLVEAVVFASSAAALFDAYEQVSLFAAVAALPATAWEMSPAGPLLVKGFGPAAVAERGVEPGPRTALVAA